MPSSNAALHSGNPLIFKRPASPTSNFASKGGKDGGISTRNFFNQDCVSFTCIFWGSGINMTKRKGKFENVYSKIAWRGQREPRRERADGCRRSRCWQRFSMRTSTLFFFFVFFWGRFQQSRLVLVVSGQLKLMMGLTSSLRCCSTAAYVTARAHTFTSDSKYDSIEFQFNYNVTGLLVNRVFFFIVYSNVWE